MSSSADKPLRHLSWDWTSPGHWSIPKPLCLASLSCLEMVLASGLFYFSLVFISIPVEGRLVDRQAILSVSEGTWGFCGCGLAPGFYRKCILSRKNLLHSREI